MGFFKTEYKNQVIVKGGVRNEGIENVVTMLEEKTWDTGLNSKTVELDAIPGGKEKPEIDQMNTRLLRKAMEVVTTETRLYLVGHGSWRKQTIGGLNASVWAERLVECGLKTAPKLISIVGCNAARDKGTTEDNRINVSINSFASQFHENLKRVHGLKTFVFARPYTITVYQNVGGVNKKTTHTHEGPNKPDVLPAKYKELHHGERRKLCFYWEGEQQRRAWVVYAPGAEKLMPIAKHELDRADALDGFIDIESLDFGSDADAGVNPLANSGGIGKNPGSLTASWDFPEFNE